MSSVLPILGKWLKTEMDRYMSVFNNEGYLIKESKAKRCSGRSRRWLTLTVCRQKSRANSREGLIEYLAALANSLDVSDDIMNDKFAPTYKEGAHQLPCTDW